MSIKYQLTKLKDPTKPADAGKYYAISTDSELISLDEMAQELERTTVLSRADIHAALTAMADFTKDKIMEGKSIQLGDLGILSATIHSKGTARPQDFKPSMIEGVKVRFRASSNLKGQLKLAEFKRADAVATPNSTAPKPASTQH